MSRPVALIRLTFKNIVCIVRKRMFSNVVDELEVTREYDLLSQCFGVNDITKGDHRILLVYPRIRHGSIFELDPLRAKLRLDEAVTLVNTLPSHKVVETMAVSTDDSTKKKRLWKSGRIEKIAALQQKVGATAIMIDVDVLTPVQQAELSPIFRVPLYDRYSIVLLIFKLYAKTKEAKLQIQLAEIPYIRQRLQYALDPNSGRDIVFADGSSKSRNEKMEILRFREQHLRKALKAVVDNRLNLRLTETQRNAHAIVAVVGYTNAGKSSLIKKLTGQNLYIEDRLFATLDTSLHMFRFSSGVTILLADTIGFISNLPPQLLASFRATLSYVANADLLIHVEDLSHPDHLSQRRTVLETLRDLKISPHLVDEMVHVCNKIDKVEKMANHSNLFYISCKDGRGLPELMSIIEKKVMHSCSLVVRRLKLRPGSKAHKYLQQNLFFGSGEITATEDNQYIVCDVVMTDDDFNKFKCNFAVAKC